MPEPDKASTSVKVAVRCRPLLPKELAEGCQSCLTCVPGESQVILGRDKAFTFDFAFGPSDPQSQVYEQAVQPLVTSLFKGFNATVLAYGQTGSGKTFTMGSCHDIGSGSSSATAAVEPAASDSPVHTAQLQPHFGVIPRVIEELFVSQLARGDEYEFSTRVSFLEIYNEELTDLLVTSRGGSSSEDLLSIREDLNGIKIVGLTEVPVSNVHETLRLLEKGSQSRTTASTNMNATSSRSHAIFTLHIEKKKRSDLEDCCRAKFHLVDLAGSERAKRTGAEGSRFKEGVNINLGLLALGNVISALGEEGGKRSHVPYRDSKLTRLLQDSLGGNSFTLMIACVSPADSNMEETLNTLRYADRARKIKNKPVVNRDPLTAELFLLRAQVQQLQAALASNGSTALLCGGSSIGSGSSSHGGGSGSSGTSAAAAAAAAAEARKWEQRYHELEEEHRKVNVDLQNAIDQSTELCEKVILAELARDALKNKLEQLRTDTGITLTELDESLKDPNVNPELKEKLLRVKDIQARLTKLESETRIGSLATLEDVVAELSASSSPLPPQVVDGATAAAAAQLSSPSSGRGSAADDELLSGGGGDGAGDRQQQQCYSRSYQLQRIKMSAELQELNGLLSMKQALAEQMTGNGETMRDMQRQLSELEQQVERLQRERDLLLENTLIAGTQARGPLQLATPASGTAVASSDDGSSGGSSSSSAGTASSKLSEQRRQRLKELEAQITEFRKKILDLSKVAKEKEHVDRQVQKLNSDIAELKHQRVKLMRQMKDESEATRRWKQEKDKEVLQLRARDRKLQCEKARLEQQSRLAQAYYRRKAEEAATANRRLKEALERQQKAAAERRAGPEPSHDLSSIGPRVKSYVNDDIEMQVSLRDAERHLQQQINDRRALNEQLQRLRSAKEASGESGEEKSQRLHQIKSLEQEMLLSNAQVTDLQQKIIDAKASKNVPVSERMQTLIEAKTAIRYLVSLVVGAKLAESLSVSRTAELNTSYEESAKQIQRLEAEIVEMQKFHASELLTVRREHEERVQVLLQQFSSSAAEAADAQVAAGSGSAESDAAAAAAAAQAAQLRELVKTQADEIARLCSSATKLRQENEQLRRDQAATRHKKGASSLLPAIDVPDSPYLKRHGRASPVDGVSSEAAAPATATKTTVTVTTTVGGAGTSETRGSGAGKVRVTRVKLGVSRKRAAGEDDATDTTEDSLDLEEGDEELSSSLDGNDDNDQDQSWRQDEEEMLDPETPVRPRRKQKRSLQKSACKCSTDCSTMRCSCKKKGVSCVSSGCKCLSDKCRNQQPDAESSKENQDPADAAAIATDKPRSRKGHSSTLNSTFLLDDSAAANGGDRKRSSVEAGVSDAAGDSSADLAATAGVAKKRKLYSTAKQQSVGASFFEAPRL